jgi:hypothetical protein
VKNSDLHRWAELKSKNQTPEGMGLLGILIVGFLLVIGMHTWGAIDLNSAQDTVVHYVKTVLTPTATPTPTMTPTITPTPERTIAIGNGFNIIPTPYAPSLFATPAAGIILPSTRGAYIILNNGSESVRIFPNR